VRLKSMLAASALASVFALTALPAAAGNNSGAYLAGRQAGIGNDYAAAAEYFTRALALDASNTSLMENVILANLGMGWVDRAVPVARRLSQESGRSQMAQLVLLVEQIEAKAYGDVLADYEEGLEVGPLVDGLIEAWAAMGDGNTKAALAQFEAVAQQDGMQSFALFHKGLALAMAGDYEGADALLSGEEAGNLALPRRGILAHIQVLSQLERNDDALALIHETFGAAPPPIMGDLVKRLKAGEPIDYDVVTSAKQGMAEVFFSVAGALYGEANHSYTLIYSRIAQYLDPENVDAILLSATLLEDLDQYDLATRTYDQVPPESPAFVAAELGRADALLAAERDEAAVEALAQLAKQHPEMFNAQLALGDTLRRLERFEEAVVPYDRAIGLIAGPEPRH